MFFGVLIVRGWIGLLLISTLVFGLMIVNMTDEEKRKELQQTLDYMIAEGMVKQVPGGYRLKSEQELEEEMEALIGHS
jgi:hypothetical protein